MDILLVSPSQENIYGRGVRPPYPPLGLLYLSGALSKAGFSVDVVDMDVDFPNRREFFQFVRREKPPAVGFTTVTPNFNDALDLTNWIKEIYEPFIIFGGPHSTATAESVIQEKSIDGVVIGEGELTIIEVMELIKNHKRRPVDGMIIKDKNNNILSGRKRNFIRNLDELPFPEWSLLKHHERYSPPDALSTPVATVMTSRGCPYRCSFCQAPMIWGRKIRRRSIHNVIEEIRCIREQYGIKEIHIADDDFSHNREWTLNFLKNVRKEKSLEDMRFYFMNGLRVDNVDETILKDMKKTGFISVGFGIESGSQRILNRIKKGIKLAQVKSNFKIAKRLGFKTWAFFILGLPGENIETIKKTIDFSIALDPDFAKYFYLVPYPGTEVHTEFMSKGYIKSDDYSKYGIYSEPVYELPGLNRLEVKRLLIRAYIRFYLRPVKILNIVLHIRTLTEFKLNFRAILFLFRKIKLFSH
jgi:anaerobic magnesium-protoporphyrin IX monomethyl ester cyclase